MPCLFDPTRDWKEVTDTNGAIAFVDRTREHEIAVILQCKYSQRFWVHISDEEAIERTKTMNKLKIQTA